MAALVPTQAPSLVFVTCPSITQTAVSPLQKKIRSTHIPAPRPPMAQKTGPPTRRDTLHGTTEPASSCPSKEDEGKAALTLRPASSDHPAQIPTSSMHHKQPETLGGVEGVETPHFLGDLEHTLSRPQMMGLGG